MVQGVVQTMSKLFVKLRDPISGAKISIPLEVPEEYDFWLISQSLNLVLKSLEWDQVKTKLVKKKKG